jgi:hypothetical protein
MTAANTQLAKCLYECSRSVNDIAGWGGLSMAIQHKWYEKARQLESQLAANNYLVIKAP